MMTQTVLSYLMVLALVATVGALGFGLVSLFRGGEFNKRHGNAAMRWRILLQAAALIIFFLILWLGK